MKTDILSLALISLLGSVTGYNRETEACGLPSQSLDTLAQQAISPDKIASSSAILELRSKGPEGLDALLKANAAMIQAHASQQGVCEGVDQAAAWTRVRAALDLPDGP